METTSVDEQANVYFEKLKDPSLELKNVLGFLICKTGNEAEKFYDNRALNPEREKRLSLIWSTATSLEEYSEFFLEFILASLLVLDPVFSAATCCGSFVGESLELVRGKIGIGAVAFGVPEINIAGALQHANIVALANTMRKDQRCIVAPVTLLSYYLTFALLHDKKKFTGFFDLDDGLLHGLPVDEEEKIFCLNSRIQKLMFGVIENAFAD